MAHHAPAGLAGLLDDLCRPGALERSKDGERQLLEYVEAEARDLSVEAFGRFMNDVLTRIHAMLAKRCAAAMWPWMRPLADDAASGPRECAPWVAAATAAAAAACAACAGQMGSPGHRVPPRWPLTPLPPGPPPPPAHRRRRRRAAASPSGGWAACWPSTS